MCMGSGGTDSRAQIEMEKAAQLRAQAETDRFNAEKTLDKQRENAKVLADQVNMANSDAQRRAKNRTLLAGLDSEEGSVLAPLEDPTSKSAKKAKKATLLGSI